MSCRAPHHSHVAVSRGAYKDYHNKLWQVFWLIPRLRLLPNATFRGRGISGCGAVSAENTAAGTVAESHGIPYFETITLQSYGLTMEFQNKICFLFVIINSLQ